MDAKSTKPQVNCNKSEVSNSDESSYFSSSVSNNSSLSIKSQVSSQKNQNNSKM